MAKEDEDLGAIVENGDIIRHIHIANPIGRLWPKKGDGHDYNAVRKALDEAKYHLRISVEAGAPADNVQAAAKEMFLFLKKIFK